MGIIWYFSSYKRTSFKNVCFIPVLDFLHTTTVFIRVKRAKFYTKNTKAKFGARYKRGLQIFMPLRKRAHEFRCAY